MVYREACDRDILHTLSFDAEPVLVRGSDDRRKSGGSGKRIEGGYDRRD